jgi:hypothetical protein
VRSVPLAPEVAQALAMLSRREMFAEEDDLVFPGELELGDFLDGSALRRRYTAALSAQGCASCAFMICVTPSAHA